MSGLTIAAAPPSNANPDDLRSFFPDLDGLLRPSDLEDRAPQHFTTGERVALTVVVAIDETGQPGLESQWDSCSTNVFRPIGLSTEDTERLADQAGKPLMVAVAIQRHNRGFGCHGHEYTIEPDIRMVLPRVNPHADDVKYFPAGTHVLLEGKVVSLYKQVVNEPLTPGGSLRDDRTYCTVSVRIGDTPYTTSARIDCTNYPVTYEDGILENLRGKPVTIGEQVRINAYVEKDRRGQGELKASTSSAYLLIPSPERQAAYDGLRASVAEGLEFIELLATEADYDMARREFAKLRRLELTRHECEQLTALIEQLPSFEQPVYDQRSTADMFLEAYGVDLETLDQFGFKAWARDVCVNAPAATGSNRAKAQDLFPYFHTTRTTTERWFLPLLTDTLKARVERLERSADGDKTWDDEQLVRCCLDEFQYIDDPETTEPVVWVIERCLAQGYYRRRDENPRESSCPRQLDDLLEYAIKGLYDLICRHPALSRHVGSPEQVEHWWTTLRENRADLRFHEQTKLISVAVAVAAS